MGKCIWPFTKIQKQEKIVTGRTNVKIISLFRQAHEESCQYGDAQCAACGETMERRHLKRQRGNDCVNRAVACTYCGGEVRQSNMKVRKCFDNKTMYI